MTARIALHAAATAALAALAPAQVVISEINFSPNLPPGTQWIEIYNAGTQGADLSSWSLYYATATPGRPGNYWYGFLPGSTLPAGQYVRVNWLAPVQPATPTEIYTGQATPNFLFGLGAEPLHAEAGALALMSTQNNARVNDPDVIVDWVSWGVGGLQREDLAVTAGRWVAGEVVPAAMFQDSIAWISARQAEPTPANAYFRDASPTGLAANDPGALATSVGPGCTQGLAQTPTLTLLSTPTFGNRDFGVAVPGTTTGQAIVFAIGAGKGSGSLAIGSCPIWIDQLLPIHLVLLTGQPGQTTVSVPLLGLQGGPAFVQALQWEGPQAFGTSEALSIFVGG